MIVLIEHPNHGRMHVYSQLELDRHIKLGWSVVEEEKPIEKKPVIKRRGSLAKNVSTSY